MRITLLIVLRLQQYPDLSLSTLLSVETCPGVSSVPRKGEGMPVLADHEGRVPVSGQDSFWQDLVDVDASLPLDVSAHFASLRRGRSLLAAGCGPIKPSSNSIRLPAYQGIHQGAVALYADAVG